MSRILLADKRTREMTPEEERYMMHALAGDRLIGDFIRQQMRFTDARTLISNQPVCAKCEKFAFYHKGGVQCPTCGHWSPEKTNKLKIHLREGLYR